MCWGLKLKRKGRPVPGGPEVESTFPRRGHRFHPWLGTKTPRAAGRHHWDPTQSKISK